MTTTGDHQETLRQRRDFFVEEEKRRRSIVRVAVTLVRPGVSLEYVKDCATVLQGHNYDDVVEERATSRLCGYPPCSLRALSDAQLRQLNAGKKYYVSASTRRVLDVTEFAKFCSEDCWKASDFFRAQLPAVSTHGIKLLPPHVDNKPKSSSKQPVKPELPFESSEEPDKTRFVVEKDLAVVEKELSELSFDSSADFPSPGDVGASRAVEGYVPSAALTSIKEVPEVDRSERTAEPISDRGVDNGKSQATEGAETTRGDVSPVPVQGDGYAQSQKDTQTTLQQSVAKPTPTNTSNDESSTSNGESQNNLTTKGMNTVGAGKEHHQDRVTEMKLDPFFDEQYSDDECYDDENNTGMGFLDLSTLRQDLENEFTQLSTFQVVWDTLAQWITPKTHRYLSQQTTASTSTGVGQGAEESDDPTAELPSAMETRQHIVSVEIKKHMLSVMQIVNGAALEAKFAPLLRYNMESDLADLLRTFDYSRVVPSFRFYQWRLATVVMMHALIAGLSTNETHRGGLAALRLVALKKGTSKQDPCTEDQLSILVGLFDTDSNILRVDEVLVAS